MLDKNYKDIIIGIKKEISTTQYKTMISVNKQLIELYFRLGKILSENSKWGSKFIESVSIDLKSEFSNIEGFSVRNLKRMKTFYEEYKDLEFVPQLVAQIPWGHNIVLIEKIKDIKKRKWYIENCIKNGWSRSVLELQIKSDLYSRQASEDKLTNFKNTLPSTQSDLATQTLKDPYVFDFIALRDGFKERELETKMIEQIKNVLIELRNRFFICR